MLWKGQLYRFGRLSPYCFDSNADFVVFYAVFSKSVPKQVAVGTNGKG